MAEVLLEDVRTNRDNAPDPLELKLLRAALLDDTTEDNQTTVPPKIGVTEKNREIRKTPNMIYALNVVLVGILVYILLATGPISVMFDRIKNKLLQLIVRIVVWALLTIIAVTGLLVVPL